MNITQALRLDLKNNEDLKIFTNSLEKDLFEWGPTTILKTLFEVFSKQDENKSAIAYFFLLKIIKQQFNIINGTVSRETTKNIVLPLLNTISKICKEEGEKIFPHFDNAFSWNHLVYNSLSSTISKASLYATDSILSKKIKSNYFINAQKNLKNENIIIQKTSKYYELYIEEIIGHN